VQIVTRDGFWTGEKDEMSQAYAARATGDYLWQVDSDEFYRPQDMRAVLSLLHADPSITAMSFKMLTFWGGLDYLTDGWYLRRGANVYHRLFKWGPGYQYATHRPPTVLDPSGRNLRDLHWLDGDTLARHGILLYHYSLLFPKQVTGKSYYYGHAPWLTLNDSSTWAETCYLQLGDPFRVHNVYTAPSWLERFKGEHPPQIRAMWADIDHGVIDIERRQTDDIERLLKSPVYRVRRELLQTWERVEPHVRPARRLLARIKGKLVYEFRQRTA
jgi:hypothetical protein